MNDTTTTDLVVRRTIVVQANPEWMAVETAPKLRAPPRIAVRTAATHAPAASA